jgi:hypothetical protein
MYPFTTWKYLCLTTGPTSWRPFSHSPVTVLSSCRSSTLHAAVRLAHCQLRVPLVARSDQHAVASGCAGGTDKLRCLAAPELEIVGARKAAACWWLRCRTGREATRALLEEHTRAGHDRLQKHKFGGGGGTSSTKTSVGMLIYIVVCKKFHRNPYFF